MPEKYQTEEAFDFANILKADCCEIFLRTFYEYRPEFATQNAKRLKNVEAWAVSDFEYNFENQLTHSSRRTRGDGFYWLDQVMRSAQIFGAKNYLFKGFCRPDDDFGATGARLTEISDFCARYGVKLSVVNSEKGIYCKAGAFKELKNRCPQLTAALDLKQAVKSGYPYAMYLKETQGALVAVRIPHLQKYEAGELFARLKDCSFNGAVIVGGADFAQAEELKKYIDFIKNLAN